MAASSLNPQQFSGDTGVIDAGIHGVTHGVTGDTRTVSPVTLVCIPSIPARVTPSEPRVTVRQNLVLSLTV